MENWKKIVINGQETFYSVSDLGNVRNDKTKTILAGSINNNGYKMVHLRQRVDKYCSVHRLVMKAFCPCELEDDLEVDHIDGDKTNNRLDNLRWCNRIKNMRSYRGNSVGKCYQYDLDGNFIQEFANFTEASKELGIDDTSIWMCMTEQYRRIDKWQFKNYKKDKIEPWCHPGSKLTYVYTDDGDFVQTYRSQADAAKAFGVSKSSIQRYVKGVRKLPGYVFSEIPL